MNRKNTLIITGAGAVVAVTVGGTSAALASSSTPTAHTLKFSSIQTAQTQFAKHAFALSDKDVQRGNVIGYDAVHGVYHPGTSTITTDSASSLPGGMLYTHATGNAKTGNFTGKVTGGTGKFRDVHGTFTGRATGKHGQIVKIVIVYH